MSNKLAVFGDRRMTVKEVAEALGVDERTIQRITKKLYPELVRNGATTFLNEAQATAVKSEIGRGRTDLDNIDEVQNIKSDLEMTLQAQECMRYFMEKSVALEKEIASKNAQIAADAPKVEFFEQVADSRDALQMRDVAAALNMPGWGRNKIFEHLRKNGVLDERNVPYREYQDRKYFRVIEQKYTDSDGETHINLKTLVYQRGVDFIRGLLKQGGAA